MQVTALRWVFRGEMHTAIELGEYALKSCGRSVEIISAKNVVTFLPLIPRHTLVTSVGLLTPQNLQHDYVLATTGLGWSRVKTHTLFNMTAELQDFYFNLLQLVKFRPTVVH